MKMMNHPYFLAILFLLSLLSCTTDEPAPSSLEAAFRMENNDCAAPCEVKFMNESSSGAMYSWDFGDGTNSTDRSPSHTYAFGGAYAVVLEVTDSDGQTAQANQVVDISSSEMDFITGMDLSYQPFLENNNVPFYDKSGNQIPDFVDWTSANGVNMVRLRLFHSPDPSIEFGVAFADLTRVLTYAQRIKATGQHFLLDLHYSDTWADPNKQFTPRAWENLAFNELEDSIYRYTKYVLRQFAAEDALPDMVQIGNETNLGMMWPQGKIDWNDTDSWKAFVQLTLSADRAIKETEIEFGQDIQTMLHFAGVANAPTYFENLRAQGALFDVIGLSHYSFFHTTDIAVIESSLASLANSFNKPIIIVETSYPFTLGWNDNTHNVAGLEEHIIAGYEASPAGQKAYFEYLTQILKNLPHGLGKGFIWWAPDLIAFDGPQSTNGSGFENVCVFDFESKALPVMDVFRGN